MKHFLLKFNHGVEIGAELAYRGHFRRVGEPHVEVIANEEVQHRKALERMLERYGETPSPVIDGTFRLIGRAIGWMCMYAPEWLLDRVAQGMEWFAVFSYTRIARVYPEHAVELRYMAAVEEQHQWYFAGDQLTGEPFRRRSKIQ